MNDLGEVSVFNPIHTVNNFFIILFDDQFVRIKKNE